MLRKLLAVSVGALALATAPTAAGAQANRCSGNDIVQTAKAAGSFKTLTSLLEQAGLAQTLEGRGPFTVLAPTDKAFSKVPQATLDALASDKEQLRSVLLYHVANRKLTAAKIAKRHSIKTLSGQRVGVRVRDGNVFVGGARGVKPNVAACNGVIHVINKVLIPG
jgi:uncharacterized surface protein with fasciclin (FAS1) repeats